MTFVQAPAVIIDLVVFVTLLACAGNEDGQKNISNSPHSLVFFATLKIYKKKSLEKYCIRWSSIAC